MDHFAGLDVSVNETSVCMPGRDRPTQGQWRQCLAGADLGAQIVPTRRCASSTSHVPSLTFAAPSNAILLEAASRSAEPAASSSVRRCALPRPRAYGFGVARFGPLALLTFTALSG